MRAHHIIVLITGRQLLQKSYREIIFTGEILLSFRQRIQESRGGGMNDTRGAQGFWGRTAIFMELGSTGNYFGSWGASSVLGI